MRIPPIDYNMPLHSCWWKDTTPSHFGSGNLYAYYFAVLLFLASDHFLASLTSAGPWNPSSGKQTCSLALGSTNSSHLRSPKPWSGFFEFWSFMCCMGSLNYKEMWKLPPGSNLVQSYGWTCLFPFTHESQYFIVVQPLKLLYFIQFSRCGQRLT